MNTKQKIYVAAVLSAFFIQGFCGIVSIPIVEVITLVFALCLCHSRIREQPVGFVSGVCKKMLLLLKNPAVLHFFCAIIFVVGLDVGTQMFSSMVMMGRFGWEVEETVKISHVYFVCRTIGLLLGTFLMMKTQSVAYFRCQMVICVVAMLLLAFCRFEPSLVIVLIGVVGILCSSIFPLIYSMAVQRHREDMGFISGLMMVAIAGGGLMALFICGIATDITVRGSVLLACAIYLAYIAFDSLTSERCKL